MDIPALFRSPTHPITAAFVVALALIGSGISPGFAAQISFPFTISVTYPGEPSGLCRDSSRIGAFGATVVVICSSGKFASFSGSAADLPETSIYDGFYRFIILGESETLGTLKSYPAAGTVTSWRVVNLAQRDYIEMMVGW